MLRCSTEDKASIDKKKTTATNATEPKREKDIAETNVSKPCLPSRCEKQNARTVSVMSAIDSGWGLK